MLLILCNLFYYCMYCILCTVFYLSIYTYFETRWRPSDRPNIRPTDIAKNGKQPNFFQKWKTSIFSKKGGNLNIFKNGRKPQFCFKNGRWPQSLQTKDDQNLCKRKTTLIFWPVEDNLKFLREDKPNVLTNGRQQKLWHGHRWQCACLRPTATCECQEFVSSRLWCEILLIQQDRSQTEST